MHFVYLLSRKKAKKNHNKIIYLEIELDCTNVFIFFNIKIETTTNLTINLQKNKKKTFIIQQFVIS